MTTILQVTGLTKRIHKKIVLKDITFSIGKGEIVGLVGPNGAGKTTIMKSILNLTPSNKGDIFIEGERTSYHHHSNFNEIGALIENPSLYPYLTGLDHLKMYSFENKIDTNTQKILDSLEMNSFITKKVKNYSLGMKQKLGICIALINNPKLVILDEPMNGLDPKSNVNLRNLIIELSKTGISFLISSHILSELEKLITQVIVINQGEIVTKTSLKELREVGNNYLTLKTSDNFLCSKLLSNAGLKNNVLNNGERIQALIDSPNSINDICKIIFKNNIDIIDMDRLSNDLETSLLRLID
ncbi:ABC transporter ATP-binding protein [Lentilactobacillus sp. SPB1-3]|uniref:ABC transporter ATP-binding protein n=1 Tax=Lentilactobacillus terminaliae TaxID=3003483 RepID=A0ACD5DFI6_9LACO|nr:ABC transporter ATP-binding protein [Lentilactobacillus sp. SPB1-3]MCZ0976420.1 ABC transporter ATP-binding protein [Lentilactobacillus sp. SPB1-3]